MPVNIQKLQLIRSTVDAMVQLDAVGDVNLVLHEAGVQEISPDFWEDSFNYSPSVEDRRRLATFALQDLSLTDISDIAVAFSQVFEAGPPSLGPEEPAPLEIFASHLSTQAAFVKQVADSLAGRGISMFVAHVSIEPDAEWHATIEAHLQSSHAGVVFLRPAFKESSWCDQEVGWLLGRGVPVYPLKFEMQDPYGPLGKKQARFVPDNATASQVAGMVVEWAQSKPSLTDNLVAAAVSALGRSSSYRQTDVLWEMMAPARNLTASQVAAVASATRDNNQVFGAMSAEVLLRYLVGQPGYAGNESLVRETAAARGVPLDELGISATLGSWSDSTPF